MNENQKIALERMLRQKKENEEKVSIKDVTRILYPPIPPEPSPAKQR